MQEANYPSLVPIHLDNTLVYVDRNKPSYGGIPTDTLIQQYSRPEKKQRKRYISSIHWKKEKEKKITINDNCTIGKGTTEEILSLPWIHHHTPETYNFQLTPELEKTIRIGQSSFNPILILQCLEEITGSKLLSRKNLRPIKRCINTTITFTIIPPEKEGILVLFGKSKAFVIAPKIED